MSTPRRSLVSPLKIGLPLLCLTVGGSIALSYFVQGKYDIQASCACAVMSQVTRKPYLGCICYLQDARKTVKDISSTTGTSPIKDIDLEVELQVHCPAWLQLMFSGSLGASVSDCRGFTPLWT